MKSKDVIQKHFLEVIKDHPNDADLGRFFRKLQEKDNSRKDLNLPIKKLANDKDLGEYIRSTYGN